MATKNVRPWAADAWALARKQHGVVARSQLIALGMSPEAIRHRLRNGRLHRLMPGIYAVGRPEVSELGRWMAAVLACGPQALLSHRSAAALLGIRKSSRGPVEVIVPAHLRKRRAGIRAYRRTAPEPDRWIHDDIPVTAPVPTLVDLAACLSTAQLEAAVNEADHRDLIDPETPAQRDRQPKLAAGAAPPSRFTRRLHRKPDHDRVGVLVPAPCPGIWAATDPGLAGKPSRRLLLGGAGADRGDGQPQISPHPVQAGRRQAARQRPCSLGIDDASLHPRAHFPRAGLRAGRASSRGSAACGTVRSVGTDGADFVGLGAQK